MFSTNTLYVLKSYIPGRQNEKKSPKEENASRVFLLILSCCQSHDHPQEDLAKFDYKNPLIFWLGIRWNLLVEIWQFRKNIFQKLAN